MNSKAPQLMTQTQYAAHRGVLPSAVSNYKAKGWLVFAEGPGGKLLVDVKRTDAKLNANIDPTRGRPTTGESQGGDLFEAAEREDRPAATTVNRVADVRLDLVEAQTVEKRLKNAATAGKLVPVDEAARKLSEGFRLARERMHSVVRTHAERLAAEREPRALGLFLAEEIDRAFTDLADQVAAGALAEAAEETELLADVDAALAEPSGEEDEDAALAEPSGEEDEDAA